MEKSLIHRRESIIISTIKTLDEVGLQNLSTKLIAKCEGVSEGTLFRHFKNKTEIMEAVIEHVSKFDDAIIETCIYKKLNSIERMKYFLRTYVEYYQNYPEITAVIQACDSLMYDPKLSLEIQSFRKKRKDFIIDSIRKAQEAKVVKAGIDGEIFADLIMGGLKEICLKWRLSKYSFSMKEKTMEMFDMVLDTLLEKNQ